MSTIYVIDYIVCHQHTLYIMYVQCIYGLYGECYCVHRMSFTYDVHNICMLYILGIQCKYNDINECCIVMINDH